MIKRERGFLEIWVGMVGLTQDNTSPTKKGRKVTLHAASTPLKAGTHESPCHFYQTNTLATTFTS